jgi:rubrerythrin
MPEPKTTLDQTPRGILELALKKEMAAYAFYDRLMLKSRVTMVRELLLELREGEAHHQALIQKMIEKLRRG